MKEFPSEKSVEKQKNHSPKTVVSCWRKPIFPGRHQPSIFGTSELNFRVRDGNGWTLAVINTNYFVVSLGDLYIISHLFSKCKPFFQKNSNFFEKYFCRQNGKINRKKCLQKQKNHSPKTVVCVGENLFFRAVTSQVSSARASLTSVFGMGTGGPSL
jgi:hypothetical protein